MKIINIANKVLASICILIIFTLSACEKNEQPNEDIKLEDKQQEITYSFTNPNTGQEFTIFHSYLLYENYFEAVEDNPDESLYKLYQQEVVQPVYEACLENSDFADSATLLKWVPREGELDTLKNQIGLINKDYLNEVFEESLVKSSDILPSDKKTTVCVFPENKRTPSEMLTIVETGNIIVFHSKPDLLYKAGMAHEYHHSVWVGKHYNENAYLTGLDYLILEGQAVMFETVVYPNLNSSYLVNDERFNKEHWSKIEPYLDSVATPEIIDEMIQGSSNGLPNYYGYSEGYKMIRSYLSLHPEMTVEEWTSKSPKEIFEEGNYIANYQ
ncbi:DUF2268 domain-containing putative Zn-dependent protease [Sporosarcina sp. 179-K 8C2 HS]|uniref:DUF2268 domain-containing putative Zn-dependent protease n=1 Tax=Sporosarcina sp. 179-K 8C2 HS TaxID=3142387 RepID=UPI00399F2710